MNLADASGTVALLGAAAATGGALSATATLSVADCGGAAELMSDASGQRVATTDGGGAAAASFSWTAVSAGRTVTMCTGGSVLPGGGNSACALAIERCMGTACFGVTGLASGDASGVAACDTFSLSERRYQQCRLVPCSMR